VETCWRLKKEVAAASWVFSTLISQDVHLSDLLHLESKVTAGENDSDKELVRKTRYKSRLGNDKCLPSG
jgi:hypothetical protein